MTLYWSRNDRIFRLRLLVQELAAAAGQPGNLLSFFFDRRFAADHCHLRRRVAVAFDFQP
jgi:hypothetical protein